MLAIVFPTSVWAQASYTEVYRLPSTESHYISSTHYDYSKVAGSLTEGCKTDFEKIEAIYDWRAFQAGEEDKAVICGCPDPGENEG